MTLEYIDCLLIEVQANNRVQIFAKESGKNRGVIIKHAQGVVRALLEEKGEDTRFYEVTVTWLGGMGTGEAPRPVIKVKPKDIVTALGDTA
jgi:hypothetical protein